PKKNKESARSRQTYAQHEIESRQRQSQIKIHTSFSTKSAKSGRFLIERNRGSSWFVRDYASDALFALLRHLGPKNTW
ncbi:MAG: hypothetical protein M3436_15060, partial [Pseudomonadota bacterium]|nr:hypothetical protein [Pseudomonadota bacterium]